MGTGDVVGEAAGEGDDEIDGDDVEAVHPTSSPEQATTTARRANMARQYSSGAPAGSDVRRRYRAAMTSSGMSKFA
jgi:hypothetical protein